MNQKLNHPTIFVILSLLIALFVFAASGTFALAEGTVPTGATYYVDAASSANNPDGSPAAPYPTIGEAVKKVRAGDTVYVRSGTYQETIKIWASGTAEQKVVIAADPDNATPPIIDGASYTLPDDAVKKPEIQCATHPVDGIERCFVYRPLVDIRGQHIEFRGFVINGSRGRGIAVTHQKGVRSSDILISDCVLSANYYQGIKVRFSDRVTIQRCQVFLNGSFAPFSRPGSELGWGAAVALQDADGSVVRENIVHENYGEGITAGRNTTNTLIENNESYNNMALQIYLHRTQRATVQNNFAYHTNDPQFWRSNEGPSDCIAINNENGFQDAISVEGIIIRDNVLAGCGKNVVIWTTQGTGDPVRDVLVEHNSLINPTAGLNTGEYGFSVSAKAKVENVRFQNNIVHQRSGSMINVSDGTDVTFNKNLWWDNAPPPRAQDDEDIVADPLFAAVETALFRGMPVDPFLLLEGSPALNNNIGPRMHAPPVATPVPQPTATATPPASMPSAATPTTTAPAATSPVNTIIATPFPAGAPRVYLPSINR